MQKDYICLGLGFGNLGGYSAKGLYLFGFKVW